MEINKSNYELYMIDYLDGKLSLEVTEKLLLFINDNEDIKTEYELLKNPEAYIINHTDSFDLKDTLKKTESIQVDDYNEKLIAKLESDLSVKELQLLNADIAAYPELLVSYKQFEQTKLIADNSITYKNKEALKKKAIYLPLYTRYAIVASIAAVLIFMIGFVLINPKQNQTASVEAIKPITKKTIASTNKNYLKNEPQNKFEKNLVLGEKIKKNIIQEDEPVHIKKTELVLLGGYNKTSLEVEVKNLNSIAVQKEFPLLKYKHIEEPVLAQHNYLTPQEYLQKILNESAQQSVVDKNKPSQNTDSEKNKIGFALIGLFNKATGSDVKLVRKYNDDGKLTGYSLAANTLFANSR